MNNTRHDVRIRSTLVFKFYCLYPPLRILLQAYTVPGVLSHSLTELAALPGEDTGFLQNFWKFRERVRKSHRTCRSSGYCGTGVQNSQKFSAGIPMLYQYPVCCGHGRTELPGVSGTGMNVVQKFQKFRVRV